MKLYFRSLTIPKKSSKRVQEYFSDSSVGPDMKLSKAQEITAQMLGYYDWHDLVTTTKKKDHIPSLLDEECDLGTQLRRINYQNDVFGNYCMLIDDVRREITIKLRVSAKNPKSPGLGEQNFNINKVKLYLDPFDNSKEWRFYPSQRSEQHYNYIFEYHRISTEKKVTLSEYFEGLEMMLAQRPEDIYVMEEMLRVSQELEIYDLIDPFLDTISSQINKCFPDNFPETGYYHFNWGTIENRSLLRSTFWLAIGFYRLRKWNMSYKWFDFTSRASKYFRYECIDFIKDLRRDRPKGNIEC